MNNRAVEWWSFWGLLGLLFTECEYLLRVPEHKAVRESLRAWIGLPAHDIVFVAVAFLILARSVRRDRIPEFCPSPFSARWVTLHLVYVAILDRVMLPIHRFTQEADAWQPIWIPLLGGFVLTWLACLIRPDRWLEVLRAWWKWGAVALAVAGLSVFLSKALALCWYALPKATLWLTQAWLGMISDQVFVDEALQTVGCQDFSVRIYAFCSGYEGMGLVVCFLCCYLWLKRRELTFPRALLLLPLGMVLSFLANTVRLALLVMLGAWVSPKLASQGFHFRAGWLTFVIVCMAVVIQIERRKWFHREAQLTRPVSLPYLLPLLLLLVLQLLTLTFSGEFDFYYPLRVILVGGVIWAYREHYGPLLGSISLRALFCGVGVYFCWILLAAPGVGSAPTEFLGGSALTLWVGFRVCGSVVLVPMVEELFFRGYLLRRLQSRDFESVPIGRLTLPSVAISSLCFGFLHQSWLAGIVAGLGYALVLRNRGGLADAIVAHGITNLCLVGHVLGLGAWGYW